MKLNSQKYIFWLLVVALVKCWYFWNNKIKSQEIILEVYIEFPSICILRKSGWTVLLDKTLTLFTYNTLVTMVMTSCILGDGLTIWCIWQHVGDETTREDSMHTNKRTDKLSQAQQRPMSLSTQLHLSVLKTSLYFLCNPWHFENLH